MPALLLQCRRTMTCVGLLPEAEFLDDGAVALYVLLAHVVQEMATPAHEAQQPAAAREIFLVDLEVLGELHDALGQERDLHFGRPGIGVVFGVALNDFLLAFFGRRHSVHLSWMLLEPSTPSVSRAAEKEESFVILAQTGFRYQ